MSADKLDIIIQKLNEIQAQLSGRVGAAASNILPATAVDLDGKYGDPEVRFDPKRWNGPSMKGKRYSQCPPEFLALLADALLYFAQQNSQKGEAKKADYDSRDAARALGWEKRKRDGWKPDPNSPSALFGDDDVNF